ncbi:MAG: M42 family metallopeptidase [Clostridiaceae bacterium]|nr:M42 family metallopeptidase [Clostridiaceae bacterium]
MGNKELLRDLCKAASPSGREHWVLPVIRPYFQPFGEITLGNLNNIYVKRKGLGSRKIMLMAHADEVFLMITEISERGFLKFKSQGIDPKVLVSQEVCIHGKKEILGIIGIKPPHLMKKEEKENPIDVDDLIIDTGYTKETLETLVSVGDYVTMKREFYELLNNNVTSKAIDDRAGIVAMYKCAKDLAKVKLRSEVVFVCSAQEEVGHRGAQTACFDLKPDIAIAIDVTFDSGNFGAKDRENKLGAGPVICVGPNIHPRLKQYIMDVANQCNIKYQIEVEPGNTGTDAWDIQVAGLGIPTLLISIPIKYMHTSVEVVNMEDIKNTGKLISKFIEKIDKEELEEVLCF